MLTSVSSNLQMTSMAASSLLKLLSPGTTMLSKPSWDDSPGRNQTEYIQVYKLKKTQTRSFYLEYCTAVWQLIFNGYHWNEVEVSFLRCRAHITWILSHGTASNDCCLRVRLGLWGAACFLFSTGSLEEGDMQQPSKEPTFPWFKPTTRDWTYWVW